MNLSGGIDDEKGKKLEIFTQNIKIGKSDFVMTTVRDVSHWLELERQRHLQKIRTVAFASAAHEFRNPLNGIS